MLVVGDLTRAEGGRAECSQAAELLMAQKGGQPDEAALAAEFAKQRENRRAAEKELAELETRIAALAQVLSAIR